MTWPSFGCAIRTGWLPPLFPLPPASPPDDWAPVVTLPGAPQESAAMSAQAAAREYSAAAGQTAWRRSLAPRHQSAVKKYFGKDKDK